MGGLLKNGVASQGFHPKILFEADRATWAFAFSLSSASPFRSFWRSSTGFCGRFSFRDRVTGLATEEP